MTRTTENTMPTSVAMKRRRSWNRLREASVMTRDISGPHRVWLAIASLCGMAVEPPTSASTVLAVVLAVVLAAGLAIILATALPALLVPALVTQLSASATTK